MTPGSFDCARLPTLVFGAGRIGEAARLARPWGTRALLVTGRRSFEAAGDLLTAMSDAGMTWSHVVISGEPSPADIDDAAANHADVDVVLAVGGGAVVDAGKAISAMIPVQQPVTRFLEGVGDKRPPGVKVPFVACPTTAGTGAEATKNAVITEVGPQGFKKSLRHDAYVPNAVVIDPALACSCPAEVTAACGMDALTQLIEAFVSPSASPLTDGVARSGLVSAARSIRRVVEQPESVDARADMAWAAYASGVALAQAGLGIVHGLASPLGGFYPIPHGVVCGTLLPAATRVNVRELLRREPGGVALEKHAEVAQLFGIRESSVDRSCEALVHQLESLKADLGIPDLSAWGIGVEDRILDGAGLKKNPVALERSHIAEILQGAGACLR